MHVMEGDCTKSEVIAEKAPELSLLQRPSVTGTKVSDSTISNKTITTAELIETTKTNTITVDSISNDVVTIKKQQICNNNNNNDVLSNNEKMENENLKENSLLLIDGIESSNKLEDKKEISNNCEAQLKINEKIGSNLVNGKKVNNTSIKNTNLDSGIDNKVINKIEENLSVKRNNDDEDMDENSMVIAEQEIEEEEEEEDDEETVENDDDDEMECENQVDVEDETRNNKKNNATELNLLVNGNVDKDVVNKNGDNSAVNDNRNSKESINDNLSLNENDNDTNDMDEEEEEDEEERDDNSNNDNRNSEKQDNDKLVEDLSMKKQESSSSSSSSSSSGNNLSNSDITETIINPEENDSKNTSSNNPCVVDQDDRNSTVSSSILSNNNNNNLQNRKRSVVDRGPTAAIKYTTSPEANEGGENEVEGDPEGEGSSSESEGGVKRQRMEVEAEDERERLVRDYVERCTQNVEEMSKCADKLQREIGALGELARAKELEWNSILRLRKLKEEMLERLLRRRRQAMMLSDNGLNQEWAADYTKPKLNRTSASCNSVSSNCGISGQNTGNQNQLMMVPVVSSSPGNITTALPSSRPILSSPDTTRTTIGRIQRPILPKPTIINQNQLSGPAANLLDPQNSIIGEGRQGTILDVKSIIADYRSRHPENVPRRGRRMKSPMVSSTRISGSPALMSMANMALCSGAHIRNTSQDCLSVQESSRPSSTESTRSAHQTTELPAPGLSFKDVLVQFAKLSQPQMTPTSSQLSFAPPLKQPVPPPPPYPEVTLHPVPAPQSPPPTHSSLLHGILTKTTATSTIAQSSTSTVTSHRATTFSPTLARLLTAPERERSTPTLSSHFRPPTSRVSINDLLTSSKKTRNEITITPVSSQSSPIKSKEEVVLLDDDETDSTDRLVIDEGADVRESKQDTSSDPNGEDVPVCQGCHQRSAQFVCAGCGNQWYCSRECQVTAWEDHSEMCSG